MPNSKSQKADVLRSAKRTLRNKNLKSALKTTVKKANASIEAGSENKAANVKAAEIALNKSVGQGITHRNTASRKISRMVKRANAAAEA